MYWCLFQPSNAPLLTDNHRWVQSHTWVQTQHQRTCNKCSSVISLMLKLCTKSDPTSNRKQGCPSGRFNSSTARSDIWVWISIIRELTNKHTYNINRTWLWLWTFLNKGIDIIRYPFNNMCSLLRIFLCFFVIVKLLNIKRNSGQNLRFKVLVFFPLFFWSLTSSGGAVCSGRRQLDITV